MELKQPNPAFQRVPYDEWMSSNGTDDFFVTHPNPVVVAGRILTDEERRNLEEKLMRQFAINHTPLTQAG